MKHARLKRALHLLCFLAPGIAFAQDTTLLPEIRSDLAAATDDTARSLALARICFNLIQSDPDSARWYGERALALARRTGKAKALGDAWNNLGWLDAQYGRLDSAEARLVRALACFKRTGNRAFQSVALSNLGWVADKRGDVVGAIGRFRSALHLSEGAQDSAGTAILLYAIGTAYRKMNEPERALEQLGKARAMEQAMGRTHYEAVCLMAIANTELTQGDTAAAIKAYTAVFPLFVRTGDKLNSGLTNENLGNAYLPRRPRQALACYNTAFIYYDSVGAKADQAYVLLGLAQAKVRLLQYAGALADLRTGQALAKATGSTALVLDHERALAELAGTMGNAADAVAHYSRYIDLKDSLQGAETQRELARLRTGFESERKEKDNDLLRAENRVQQERIRQRNLQVIGLLALAALALFAALLFRRNYRQKRRHAEVLERLNHRLETGNAEITEINSLLESRLLRSQMNPHFIYNALGSAIELNDAGRSAEATDYLRGFARLLRMVLDHSVGGTVTIAGELEFLRQYLLLESKRVEGLRYAVEAEPALVEAEAELPALVVQPFVENAVWHGLSQQPGERTVLVHFSRHGAGMRCSITDNGVGRGRNGGPSRVADHRSVGMQLTEERLRLLSRRIGGGGSLHVEDLMDAEGRPAGTRVTLRWGADRGGG